MVDAEQVATRGLTAEQSERFTAATAEVEDGIFRPDLRRPDRLLDGDAIGLGHPVRQQSARDAVRSTQLTAKHAG